MFQLMSRVFSSRMGRGVVFTSNFPLKSSFSVGRNSHCWKCHQPLPVHRFLLQCPSCRTLQKPDTLDSSVNYFKIFGVDESYQVNLSKLSAEMKILQKNLHPDLFSMKSKEEQELSENLSSLVNKAYATLQEPLERAVYLLRLRGIDENALEKQMTSDPEFLGEVMELNEKLEEIDDKKNWASFREENNQMIRDLTRQLEVAFDSDQINEAVLILAKLKFYDNLQRKLKDVQSRLGIVD